MDNKKIKIVRIINRFNIGGPTYNATFLTRFLSDDFETVLIGGVPDEGEKDSLHILENYGVKPIVIPSLKRDPDVKSDREAYKQLKEIIQREKPDIVHTHASKAGLLGRKAAFACNVKIVVHTFHGHVFHSYFGKIKTELIKLIERRLAKKSTGIIAISDLQKNEIASEHKICKPEKITVIPLGFDLGKFQDNKEVKRKETREKYGVESHEVAIAIVGRLAPIKDHFFFLNVIEQLLPELDTPVKIFIVGDGSEKEVIEQKVKELNALFPKTLVMTSWILDIASFNHGMDIICLTSKNEGTPVSLIEAQASGIPVVSTDVGGVRDIVQDGISGYVIKKGDNVTYAKKLRSLIEDSELRSNFAKKGAEFVKERYHYTTLVSNMENYYKSLLEQHG